MNGLPVSLFVAWIVFFGFALAQAHFERTLQESYFLESPFFVRALEISTLLALIAGLGILGYYFLRASWYLPFIVGFLGSLIGAVVMGLMSQVAGLEFLSKLAFFAWPGAAWWAVWIIHHL